MVIVQRPSNLIPGIRLEHPIKAPEGLNLMLVNGLVLLEWKRTIYLAWGMFLEDILFNDQVNYEKYGREIMVSPLYGL